VLKRRNEVLGPLGLSVGPMEWNSLRDSVRNHARNTDSFRSALKTRLFAMQ